MSFRLRLALAAALAVTATVAIASGVVYVVMRNELRTSVDQQLVQQYKQVLASGYLRHVFAEQGFPAPPQGPSASATYVQIVFPNGTREIPANELEKVPVTKQTLAVAAGKQGPFFTGGLVGTKQSRIYTVPGQVLLAAGGAQSVALQLVRPTDDITRTLQRLQLILLLVLLGGLAAGAAGGALVSRSALVPVRRLTGTAERIAETGEPSERVPVNGRDELSRLGGAFNTMLAALEESLDTQRRFVADASHELRTPLTSMQTNIEVLKQHERLDPDARGRLYADLEREAHEMRDLIAGLLELARGDDPGLQRTTVHVDELVENGVGRARARFPQLTWAARIEQTTVEGVPERLERAVWNLLENAGKWSREGSSVDVLLAHGELVVRDYGPGIAEEDRERVFDRFYRATAARSLPGSGLGLAIVREIAEAHGGSVSAEEAPGGGALLRLRLPEKT
ncbi:MAG: two-component system, OmpR family, sensor histidine kinase MprB [Gaiellaceae bacterium]|nr:two-component system, OmpR family, sensor histidine kinase MprB [Gaiellaceae bacterium]MDX6472908.1 two-component system, OmpR family, sensor histidine kinase MprB [Gaiellaceae bacterium]